MTPDLETVDIYQALTLPRGRIRSVIPKIVHNGQAYAYTMQVELAGRHNLAIDVRQVPIAPPELQGQYGEMVVYITKFAAISHTPLTSGSLACRYLGSQMSLVFFQELLDRYHFLQLQGEETPQALDQETEEGDEAEIEQQDQDQHQEDGIPEFQDRYETVLAQYHPKGFALGAYDEAHMLQTPLGTFLLGTQAIEQI